MRSFFMKKQIFLNILTSYAGKGIGALLGIFLVPFLIKKLGTAAFGITVLVESMIVIVDMESMSVRTALSRHLTFCLSQGNQSEFHEYLRAGRKILFFLSFFVLASGLVSSFYAPHIFQIPPELIRQTQGMFLA